MNKKISIKLECLLLLCSIAVILSSGCDPLPDEKFYEFQAPTEKLQDIEALDLEQMSKKEEEEPAPDVNTTPPKEAQLALEDCRALALSNNLGLKVQLINPSIAAKNLSAEEAKFEASFFSNINYTKTDTPIATLLTGSSVENSNVNLGVQVPLSTGGLVSFNLADNRIKTNEAFATLNPAYITDLSVSISQPLLRNAGNRANTHSIRIADYDLQIVDARTKLEIIRVLAAADRVYWRLDATRRELEVRKQQYDLAVAQLQQARRFVDSGEKAQVEVVRSEAGVAERLEGIIIAENGVRDRQRELKQILNRPGLDMQSPTVLITSTDPDPVHYEFDNRSMVSAAIENRMEMLELELQLAQDISTLDYQKNQALPLVTMDYTYNVNGLGETRSDSYDLLTDHKFQDHMIGLQLLVPLGNKAAKSRVMVLNAIDQLEANWQRILAARQNVLLQERLFKAEQRQFELGLRTSTDVLDAQTKFAEAQSSEILALGQYQISQVDLAFATGTLLGAAKVQWQPIVPQTTN
ncbi:MAG: TolC family protein [Planctomycetota bacterium]|jgi:outer membrane protein TolC